MSVVLDASLTLAWCFRDEATARTAAALHHVAHEGALVPELWVSEVANGLLTAMRRLPERVTPARVAEFLLELRELPIEIVGDREATMVERRVDLARRFGITAYDACYLELALQSGLPLGTLDGDGRRAGLKQAAVRAGVSLWVTPLS